MNSLASDIGLRFFLHHLQGLIPSAPESTPQMTSLKPQIPFKFNIDGSEWPPIGVRTAGYLNGIIAHDFF